MRRTPPEAIAIEIRRASHFGCVLCGEMPCDYEHIVPYKQVKAHEIENMVLLCTKHHREVSSGRISKKVVKEAQKSPFAARGSSFSKYSFDLKESEYGIAVGSNVYTVLAGQVFALITLGGVDIFSFRIEMGVPLFSFSVENSDGSTCLELRDNTFHMKSEYLDDVKLSGKKFTVKNKLGSKIIDINFSNSEICFNKLEIISHGCAVAIDKKIDRHMIGENLSNVHVSNCSISLRHPRKASLFRIGQDQDSYAFMGSEISGPPATYNKLRDFINDKSKKGKIHPPLTDKPHLSARRSPPVPPTDHPQSDTQSANRQPAPAIGRPHPPISNTQ